MRIAVAVAKGYGKLVVVNDDDDEEEDDDFAYSMRMAPRSDERRYFPCKICIARPALCTSVNSTNATGM